MKSVEQCTAWDVAKRARKTVAVLSMLFLIFRLQLCLCECVFLFSREPRQLLPVVSLLNHFADCKIHHFLFSLSPSLYRSHFPHWVIWGNFLRFSPQLSSSPISLCAWVTHFSNSNLCLLFFAFDGLN